MLGEQKGTFRPMLKLAQNKKHSFNALVLDGDYNVTNNFALMAKIPLVLPEYGKFGLGDVGIAAKYQFFRKDGMGKTIRIAAKAENMFASGKKLETMTLGMGHNMTYLGVLAARESLKLGTQAEIGYAVMPSASHLNHLQYKVGFGIPLLEPVYPVNQLNIYLEFEGLNLSKHLGTAQYGYYFAPGFQYAKGIYTFDLSVQMPIKQQFQVTTFERKLVGLLGMRVII
jgi:hypothetical protein